MNRPEIINEIFNKYLVNSLEFLENRGLSHEKDLEYCLDSLLEINALLKDTDYLTKERQELQIAPSVQTQNVQEYQESTQIKSKIEDKKREIEPTNSAKVFVKLKSGTESNKTLKEKGLKKIPTLNTALNKPITNKNKLTKTDEDSLVNHKPLKSNHKVNLSLNLTYTKLEFNKKLDKNSIFRNDNKKDSFKIIKQNDTDRSNDKTKEIIKNYSSKENVINRSKNDNKKEKTDAKYLAHRTIRISHMKNNSTSFGCISDYVTESNTLTNRFIGNILSNSLLSNTTLSPPSNRRNNDHCNSEKRKKYKFQINKEINDDSKINEMEAENNQNEDNEHESNPNTSNPVIKSLNDNNSNSVLKIISPVTVQDNNLLSDPSSNVNNKTLELNIKSETINDLILKNKKNLKEDFSKLIEEKDNKIYNFTTVLEENWNILFKFFTKKDFLKLRLCNKKYHNLSNESIISCLQEDVRINTEKINLLKEKNSEDLKKIVPDFSLGRSSSKAIELLEQDKYKNLFRNKVFPSEDILLPYRIYFTVIRKKEIANIVEDQLFWEECCKFFNVDHIGNMLASSTKMFDFSYETIYSIYKMSYNKDKKLASSYFTKICPTTGIIIFLIREILEYSGIFINQKFPPTPNKMFKLYHAIVEGDTGRIEKIKQFKKF